MDAETVAWGGLMAKKRDRSAEYARQKAKRLARQVREESVTTVYSVEDRQRAEDARRKLIDAELVVLSKKMANQPTDADRDIDFAYRHAGNPELMPLECPSLGAWQFYEYARNSSEKFLDICAKREDAKAKAAGTITSQRMEDDKRQKFAVIDRIIAQLQLDVKEMARDMMTKCPEDFLLECRKFEGPWKAFFAKYPL